MDEQLWCSQKKEREFLDYVSEKLLQNFCWPISLLVPHPLESVVANGLGSWLKFVDAACLGTCRTHPCLALLSYVEGRVVTLVYHQLHEYSLARE